MQMILNYPLVAVTSGCEFLCLGQMGNDPRDAFYLIENELRDPPSLPHHCAPIAFNAIIGVHTISTIPGCVWMKFA